MNSLQNLLELAQVLKIEYINITKTGSWGTCSVGYIESSLTSTELNINEVNINVNDLHIFIKNKEFALTSDNNKILGKAGRSKAEFTVLNIDADKPKQREFKKEVTIPQDIIKSLSLCNKSDSRFYTHGAGYAENMIAISNGLALVFSKCDTVFNNIIPIQAMQLSDKYNKNIKITEDDSFCSVECDGNLVILGMITGGFPPFSRAMPQTINYAVSVSSKELREILTTAQQFYTKEGIVKLTFKNNTLFIETGFGSSKKYTSELECSYAHNNELEISFKLESLLKLASLRDETDFLIESPEKPVKIGENALITTARI